MRAPSKCLAVSGFVLYLTILVTGCPENPIELPTERINSGFEMARDSFPFKNFGGEHPRAKLTSTTLARMFGEAEVCASVEEGVCRATPIASEYIKRVNEAMTGGRCEGFAVLSGLVKLGKVQVADLGIQGVATADLNGANSVAREIGYWFSSQYLREVVKSSTRSMNAREVLSFLTTEYKKPDHDLYRLGIVKLDASGKATGGHAVLAIATQPKTGGNGQYGIAIYDNNHPGAERELLVDANANRWWYQASTNPDEAASLYEGTEANGNLVYVTAVTPRAGVHPCPFCSGDGATGEAALNQVFTFGSAEVSAVDATGKAAGEVDGKFVADIAGSVVGPTFSAETWLDRSPPILLLPRGAPTTLQIRSAEGEAPGAVAAFLPGAMAGVENATGAESGTARLELNGDGTEVKYVPAPGSAPTLVAGRETSTGAQTTVRMDIPAAAEVSEASIGIDVQSGDATLAAEATGDIALDVEVTKATAEGEQAFAGTVEVPSGGTTTLLVQDWAGEGDPMGAETDRDGDGTPEESTEVPNAGQEGTAPNAPTGLAAVATSHERVELTWADASTNEESFLLERDAGNGFEVFATPAPNATSAVDPTVTHSRQYRYRIRAANRFGNSDFSAVALVTTPGCPSGTQDNDADTTCTADCATAALGCVNGACSDASGTAACVCDEGYTGATCGSCAPTHQDNDGNGTCLPTCAAAGLNCGHGNCVDGSGTASCTCQTGYTGAACDTCVVGYGPRGVPGTCAPLPDAATSGLTVSAEDGIVADGLDSVTITIRVLDLLSNPVAGAIVTVAASGTGNTLVQPATATDSSGFTTATLSSTDAGTKTISATADGLSLGTTRDVRFVAGPLSAGASTVTVAPATGVVANGTATASVTITLRDAQGNPVSGATASVSATGTANTLVQPGGPSGADGVLTATIASTRAETKTLTVTAGATTLTDTPTVQFVAGDVSATTSTASASPATGVLGDGVAFSTITVRALDANGNGISGAGVVLSTAQGSVTFVQPAATAADGTTTGRVSSTVQQVVTVSVHVNGTTLAAAPTVGFAGPYSIGGTLTGLPASASIVLRNNGGDAITRTSDGAFTFPTRLVGAYAVTVATQPAGALCDVTNGTGSASANVTNVAVTCRYNVGGTLIGLPAGDSVVLQSNGGDDLTRTTNGAFTFATRVGGAYWIRVSKQPAQALCQVRVAAGTATADVTSVVVRCEPTSLPVTNGLAARYSALVTSSVTKDASNLVTQWNDLSGNGRHLTTSGSLRPTATDALINGRPAIDFNGTKRMSTAAFPLTAEVTVFVVALHRAPNQPAGAYAHHGSRDTDWSIEEGLNGTHMQFQSNNASGDTTLPMTPGENHVVCGRITGTSREFTVVGASASRRTATGVSIVTGAKTLNVGSSDNGEGSHAAIGELVYFDRALSDAERDAVFTHLRRTWGLPVPAPDHAWYDATQLSSVVRDGAGNVTSWQDRTANARHALVGSSTSPTWTPDATPNGAPALNFASAGSGLTTAAFSAPSQLSLFAAFRTTTPASNAMVVGQGNGTPFALRKSGTNLVLLPTTGTAASIPLASDTWQVASAVQSATGSTLASTTGDTNTSAGTTVGAVSAPLFLGNGQGGAQQLGGLLGEVRVYATALLQTDVAYIEDDMRLRFSVPRVSTFTYAETNPAVDTFAPDAVQRFVALAANLGLGPDDWVLFDAPGTSGPYSWGGHCFNNADWMARNYLRYWNDTSDLGVFCAGRPDPDLSGPLTSADGTVGYAAFWHGVGNAPYTWNTTPLTGNSICAGEGTRFYFGGSTRYSCGTGCLSANYGEGNVYASMRPNETTVSELYLDNPAPAGATLTMKIGSGGASRATVCGF